MNRELWCKLGELEKTLFVIGAVQYRLDARYQLAECRLRPYSPTAFLLVMYMFAIALPKMLSKEESVQAFMEDVKEIRQWG